MNRTGVFRRFIEQIFFVLLPSLPIGGVTLEVELHEEHEEGTDAEHAEEVEESWYRTRRELLLVVKV